MAEKRVQGSFLLTDDVRDILSRSRVNGCMLYLPAEQLNRKLYETVDKALKGIGGKWNRYERAHVFQENPQVLLEGILTTGEGRTLQKETELFPTPPALAARMAAIAESSRASGLAIPKRELGISFGRLRRRSLRQPL